VVHFKTGKKAAEKAFGKSVKAVASDKRIPSKEAAEFIIDRMAEFAKSPRAKPTDRTPVHPTTWLNSGMFDDDPRTWGIQSSHTPSTLLDELYQTAEAETEKIHAESFR
jgi:hypothetical protein